METIVTCVTCEQVLTKGRCTNALCPGYVAPSEEEELQERIAALEAENERLREALFQVEAQLHYIAKPEEHYPSNVRSAWEEARAALGEAT